MPLAAAQEEEERSRRKKLQKIGATPPAAVTQDGVANPEVATGVRTIRG